jgi:hypothetical protein
MNHIFEPSFILICKEIISEKKSLGEWAEIESDDMFQIDNYLGGFDATEMAFCFSIFVAEKEYWFQISLDDVKNIIDGKHTEIEVRPANN